MPARTHCALTSWGGRIRLLQPRLTRPLGTGHRHRVFFIYSLLFRPPQAFFCTRFVPQDILIARSLEPWLNGSLTLLATCQCLGWFPCRLLVSPGSAHSRHLDRVVSNVHCTDKVLEDGAQGSPPKLPIHPSPLPSFSQPHLSICLIRSKVRFLWVPAGWRLGTGCLAF